MKHTIPLSLLLLLIGFNNYAQNPKEHDRFFLSMSLGVSHFSLNNDITNGPYNNMKISGPAATFDIKIGGAIKENFILHGDIISTSSSSADVTVDGQKIGTLSGDNSVGMIMVGAGVTYYFMPVNIFISSTIGAGNFTIATGGNDTKTEKGFGLYLKTGKEWWVSDKWGLGVSMAFNYLKVNNEIMGMTENLKGSSFGISFNSTLN